jgi:hypothetical protein
MTIFFHAAPMLLAPGSVVLPGNFGRVIRQQGATHPLWNRESALEVVRSSNYPTKPSRLDACFACLHEKTLRFYVTAMSQKTQHYLWPVLYEVEKVDQNAPEHRSDFNVVEPLPRLNKTMTEIAHLYWTAGLWINVVGAPGIRCEEMVTTSPLRILRTLS